MSLKIDGVWADNRKLRFARKIWHVLRRDGEDVARCSVARLTRRPGIRGAVRGGGCRSVIGGKVANGLQICRPAHAQRWPRSACRLGSDAPALALAPHRLIRTGKHTSHGGPSSPGTGPVSGGGVRTGLCQLVLTAATAAGHCLGIDHVFNAAPTRRMQVFDCRATGAGQGTTAASARAGNGRFGRGLASNFLCLDRGDAGIDVFPSQFELTGPSSDLCQNIACLNVATSSFRRSSRA